MVKLGGIYLFSSTFYSDYWSCALKHSSVGGARIAIQYNTTTGSSHSNKRPTGCVHCKAIAWYQTLVLVTVSISWILWIYNFHKDVRYKICTINFADEWFADFCSIFVMVSLLYFNVCVVFDASVRCWVCELCLVTWAHSASRQSPVLTRTGQVATVFIHGDLKMRHRWQIY